MQEPPLPPYFQQPYPYHTPSYQEPQPYYETYPPYHQPQPTSYFDPYQQPYPEPYYESFQEPYYEPPPLSYLDQPPYTYHDPNPYSYTPTYSYQPTYNLTYPPQTPKTLTSSSPCNEAEGPAMQHVNQLLMELDNMLFEMQEELTIWKSAQEASFSNQEDQPSPPTLPPSLSLLDSCPSQEVAESPSIGYHYVLEPSEPMGGDLMQVVEGDQYIDEVVYEEQPPPPEEKKVDLGVCAPTSIEATAGASSLVAPATPTSDVEYVETLHYQPCFQFVPLGLKPFSLALHEYAILETDTQLLTIYGESSLVQVELSWRLKDFSLGCLKALSEVFHPSSLKTILTWDAWPRGECCAPRSDYMVTNHGVRNKKRIIFLGVVHLIWDPGGCCCQASNFRE